MSTAPPAEEIWNDARWLVQAIDPAAGVVRLVAMDRQAYRDSSFLDDRMFAVPRDSRLVPWATIRSGRPVAARADARWIFHIGHVGSTLVSRLLGELDGVLAVREPRSLRDLAASPPEVRVAHSPVVSALMARTFAPGEVACVKATSLVSEIAAELVPAGGRALFLYAAPEQYLATILAGPNSLQELQLLAEARARRMAGRVVGLAGWERSAAHRAAAAWACEVTALEAAAETIGDSVMWADFDSVLADLAGWLGRIAGAFGFDSSPDRLSAIANGPLTRRYSKALEYDYGPELRAQLLDEARSGHRQAIDSALAMLGDAAEKSPLLARALARSRPEC